MISFGQESGKGRPTTSRGSVLGSGLRHLAHVQPQPWINGEPVLKIAISQFRHLGLIFYSRWLPSLLSLSWYDELKQHEVSR